MKKINLLLIFFSCLVNNQLQPMNRHLPPWLIRAGGTASKPFIIKPIVSDPSLTEKPLEQSTIVSQPTLSELLQEQAATQQALESNLKANKTFAAKLAKTSLVKNTEKLEAYYRDLAFKAIPATCLAVAIGVFGSDYAMLMAAAVVKTVIPLIMKGALNTLGKKQLESRIKERFSKIFGASAESYANDFAAVISNIFLALIIIHVIDQKNNPSQEEIKIPKEIQQAMQQLDELNEYLKTNKLSAIDKEQKLSEIKNRLTLYLNSLPDDVLQSLHINVLQSHYQEKIDEARGRNWIQRLIHGNDEIDRLMKKHEIELRMAKENVGKKVIVPDLLGSSDLLPQVLNKAEEQYQKQKEAELIAQRKTKENEILRNAAWESYQSAEHL